MMDHDCWVSPWTGQPIPIIGVNFTNTIYRVPKILPIWVKRFALQRISIEYMWGNRLGLKIVLRVFGNGAWLTKSRLFEHVEPETAGERPYRIRRHAVLDIYQLPWRRFPNESRVEEIGNLMPKKNPFTNQKIITILPFLLLDVGFLRDLKCSRGGDNWGTLKNHIISYSPHRALGGWH